MGCVSSKILAKSGSYQEKGSLGHSFQRSSVIEEIILSSSKSNGDQFLALLCASNSSARKAKEPEPEQSAAPPPAVAGPASKIEAINVSELLAGLEDENADEQSERKDGDGRSPSPPVSDGAAAAGRARSFRTVEEFDALVTQKSGSSPSERAAEREEPRAAAAAAEDDGGGASGQGVKAEEAAAGARRRARARQLGELKVPAAAFDFSKSGSLRDWLRQGGQTFSPGSYVTPKFGSAPPVVPAEHGGAAGEKASGVQQQDEEEHEVFDPELVAQFERAMEQLSEDEGRVLDEILEALESEAAENKDDTAAAAFSFGTVSNDRPAAVAALQV
ncbi:unnamed protein product [Urochloa decumbens]|uniref:Uncharacterized protein n=1 Tax=Urochloa decumbens TaxID=240449 RepID=A0ABC9C5P9_9POAL